MERRRPRGLAPRRAVGFEACHALRRQGLRGGGGEVRSQPCFFCVPEMLLCGEGAAFFAVADTRSWQLCPRLERKGWLCVFPILWPLACVALCYLGSVNVRDWVDLFCDGRELAYMHGEDWGTGDACSDRLPFLVYLECAVLSGTCTSRLESETRKPRCMAGKSFWQRKRPHSALGWRNCA